MKTAIGLTLLLVMNSGCSPLEPATPELTNIQAREPQGGTTINPKALPLGNQKYTTVAPRKGYVYACDAGMYQFTQIIGAQITGPWVNEANNTFDVTRKIYVQGAVHFNGQLSLSPMADKRVFLGNGLPIGIAVGIFPVAPSDPAYVIDGNPNTITAQNISFSLTLNPTLAPVPLCTYKRIGITLDGVELDSPLDSSGRDEMGYELNDNCGGKPQPGGSYHRQFLSDCIPRIHENNALVGYALDGFGIFSPFDESGKEFSSADLDECHGLTSEINWDGRRVKMYHYVLTRDYPYTITCFRGTPNYDAFAPLPKPIGGGPSPGPTTYNFPTDCSLFKFDPAGALAHINGETAANCKGDLNMIQQLYAQFQGKTCAQIQQIYSSLPPQNGAPPPPPPAPDGAVYQALVTCSKK